MGIVGNDVHPRRGLYSIRFKNIGWIRYIVFPYVTVGNFIRGVDVIQIIRKPNVMRKIPWCR